MKDHVFKFNCFTYFHKFPYYLSIVILNVHGSMLCARKVQPLFFYAFKTFVKYEILKNYVDRCYEANCVTCHIVAQR